MKNLFTKIISIILLTIILFSFTSCGVDQEVLMKKISSNYWCEYAPDSVYTFFFNGSRDLEVEAMVLIFYTNGHFKCYMQYSDYEDLAETVDGTYEFTRKSLRLYDNYGKSILSFAYEYENGYLDIKWPFERLN